MANICGFLYIVNVNLVLCRSLSFWKNLDDRTQFASPPVDFKFRFVFDDADIVDLQLF